MKKNTPVHVILHYPETESGKRELAKRLGEVHADMVIRFIGKQDCPTLKKQELLQWLIASAQDEERQDGN